MNDYTKYDKEQTDPPRKVTEREVYDYYFGNPHLACMRRAAEEIIEISKEYSIPLGCFSVGAITFHHWAKWEDKRQFIKQKQKEWQERNDRRFGNV